MDHLEAIRTESARFSQVAHQLDLATPVPSCPESPGCYGARRTRSSCTASTPRWRPGSRGPLPAGGIGDRDALLAETFRSMVADATQ
jgi:hypothetical protein